jgi:hypothetical protein
MRYRRFRRTVFVLTALAVLGVGWPSAAAAQSGTAVAFEGSGGWAAFVDETLESHGVIGGAARFYLTPRISIGPEITYMIGPGSDRDLFVTGNLVFDVFGRKARPRVTPYLVVGGGLFQHSARYPWGTFRAHEGAFTGGGGIRIPITPRIYVAPEFRVGWEPHVRASVTVGFLLGK